MCVCVCVCVCVYIYIYTLCVSVSCSLVSDSKRPHGLQPARLLCLRDSPGKNTAVGCHSLLLQGIFPIQGSNPGLLHCRQILYHVSHQGSPYTLLCAKETASGTLPWRPGSSARGSVMVQRGGMRCESRQRGSMCYVCLCVYTYICTQHTHIQLDSRCCTPESNVTLQSNYPPIKISFKVKKKKNHQEQMLKIQLLLILSNHHQGRGKTAEWEDLSLCQSWAQRFYSILSPEGGLLALLNLYSWQLREYIFYILCAEATCVHIPNKLF